MNKEEQIKEKQSNFLDFYNSRTPLLRSIGFLIIESLIPGILVWLFFGNDIKSVSIVNNIPSPQVAFSFLVCFGLVIYSFGSTLFFYFLKFHKSDNFTYSITLSLVFLSITLLSFCLTNSITFIFIKFIVSLFVIIIGGILGVIITSYFQNISYGIEEKNEKIYQRFLNKAPLNKKEKLIAIKIQKQKEKEEYEEKKRIEIQKKIDEKLEVILKNEK